MDINFWWVNHKQTFASEVQGGYIWSPKRNANGAYNQTYENLTHVRPGDLVISYANTLIQAVGVVTSAAISAGKPEEFGNKGENWSRDDGWLVYIDWLRLPEPMKPKDHITEISPLLPAKNSPLQANGNGNQGCYLASISQELGNLVLTSLATNPQNRITTLEAMTLRATESLIERSIRESDRDSTEKEQLIKSRVGQGLFRQRVIQLENACRVTGVSDDRFLIASHIKPWRVANDFERLDGSNGLLLAPHIDRLFDGGWISFHDNGDMLVSDTASDLLNAWLVPESLNVGIFTDQQCAYLEYHRNEVYRGQ